MDEESHPIMTKPTSVFGPATVSQRCTMLCLGKSHPHSVFLVCVYILCILHMMTCCNALATCIYLSVNGDSFITYETWVQTILLSRVHYNNKREGRIKHRLSLCGGLFSKSRAKSTINSKILHAYNIHTSGATYLMWSIFPWACTYTLNL